MYLFLEKLFIFFKKTSAKMTSFDRKFEVIRPYV